jgi:hypothetical protein
VEDLGEGSEEIQNVEEEPHDCSLAVALRFKLAHYRNLLSRIDDSPNRRARRLEGTHDPNDEGG